MGWKMQWKVHITKSDIGFQVRQSRFCRQQPPVSSSMRCIEPLTSAPGFITCPARRRVNVLLRQCRRDAHTPTTARLSPRWLSDIKSRLGKCLSFGLDSEQRAIAGSILATISRDWRELVAGSDGFLTSRSRRGLYRYPVSWAEQDPFAHVNNIVYNRYAESARIAWTRNYATHIDRDRAEYWNQLMVPRGEGLILRSIKTLYKFPMTFPDRVSVYHKLSTIPDSSDALLLDSVILSEKQQRVAARTYEDIALYDYDRGRKTNKQPWMLEVLLKTWQLQEEAKRTNDERVRDLLEQVRQLELHSWDRPDAMEDLGSGNTS